MDEAALVGMLTGPVVLAAWAIAQLGRGGGALSWTTGDWLFLVLALVMIGWAARTFIRHGKLRRRYRQGLEAEIAVAQNLLPLMAEGCIVFHDFPADGFNIDHIVVAPNAVFAIETNSRKKGKGRDSAKVVYDGRSLSYSQPGK
ncbi:MAG TPA: nuclease-related domain-containing protein [Pseudoxanthomonas sp.]|nr:nuclease-related domain-containing protein [Pseudoxanthomonas sp.]